MWLSVTALLTMHRERCISQTYGKMGALLRSEVLHVLPLIVWDAIGFTSALGEQYLWDDFL